MTMANSLELRVPFLDPEVFRVASTLPIEPAGHQGATKVALRRALAEIVPPHVLERRKLGFPVPIRHWLKDEMYDWARDIIEASGTEYLLDRAAVLRMLDEHRAGPHDYSRKLWTLLVFMIWHGIFVERRITPEIPATGLPGRALSRRGAGHAAERVAPAARRRAAGGSGRAGAAATSAAASAPVDLAEPGGELGRHHRVLLRAVGLQHQRRQRRPDLRRPLRAQAPRGRAEEAGAEPVADPGRVDDSRAAAPPGPAAAPRPGTRSGSRPPRTW